MATTRPITSFFQPVGKFSENENEAVIGGEAEAETMECENGKLFYALFHFLRNVSDFDLQVNLFLHLSF